MRWNKVCAGGLAAFLALSVADLGLTYLLVEGTGGEVYEANPVAAPWLVAHGWAGLAWFKAGAVLAVAGAACLLVRRRPPLGAAVAVAACLAVAAVDWHSARMVAEVEAYTAQPVAEILASL